MKARCRTCTKEFKYYPSNSKGYYCSLKCRNADPEYVNPMKGKKRKDLSEYNKREKVKLVGKKNPNWKGGLFTDIRRIRSTKRYKEWRFSVLKRDKGRCRLCGSEKNIEVHHIVSLKEIYAFPFERENGITLCYECHCKIDKQRYRFKCVKE